MSTNQPTQIHPGQVAAAREMYTSVLTLLRDERGVHAETAVASVCRVGGLFVLRSLDLPLSGVKPGTPVLSDAANVHGPALLTTLANTLSSLQVPFSPAEAGGPIPAGHEPHLSVLESQARIENAFRKIAENHALSDEAAAHACAIAAAQLIRSTATVMSPSTGAAIAALGFVEGLKTAPHPLAPGQPKAWYQFWK